MEGSVAKSDPLRGIKRKRPDPNPENECDASATTAMIGTVAISSQGCVRTSDAFLAEARRRDREYRDLYSFAPSRYSDPFSGPGEEYADANEEQEEAAAPPQLDFRSLADRDPELAPYLITLAARDTSTSAAGNLRNQPGSGIGGGNGDVGSKSRPHTPTETTDSEKKATLNFKDPAAVMQLTRTLLLVDFGLRIELPTDRLCPPVPNRHNYILWVKRLVDESAPLDSLSPSASVSSGNQECNDYGPDAYDPARPVLGLDIGTGASAIYPLLGCAQRSRWLFVATDIDEKSLGCARRNVALNALEDRIRVFDNRSTEKLLPIEEMSRAGLLDVGNEEGHREGENGQEEELGATRRKNIDFVMCNPPFYSSHAEVAALAAQKDQPPRSACTGADVEMIYKAPSKGPVDDQQEGGETAFVTRMLDESIALQHQNRQYQQGRIKGQEVESEPIASPPQWCTSMLGRLSSLETVVERLRARGITNYAVTSFVQGSQTRRWAVGWSFDDWRPGPTTVRGCDMPGAVAAGRKKNPKKLLPPPTQLTAAEVDAVPEGPGIAGGPTTRKRLVGAICRMMDSLDLTSWTWDEARARGFGFAGGNVWSRAYRRRKERAEVAPTLANKEGRAFGFVVTVETDRAAPNKVGVKVRWLRGAEYAVFESFTGAVRTAVLQSQNAGS